MRKADNVPTYCAVVTKSGNLNLLETSGPLQAYKGAELPLPSRTRRMLDFPEFKDRIANGLCCGVKCKAI